MAWIIEAALSDEKTKIYGERSYPSEHSYRWFEFSEFHVTIVSLIFFFFAACTLPRQFVVPVTAWRSLE